MSWSVFNGLEKWWLNFDSKINKFNENICVYILCFVENEVIKVKVEDI